MKKKVVIIGAGISGLYTAFLLQSDYDVTILEARERLGGRALSIDGHDLGPSWVWSHHKLTLELINKLKLSMFLQHTTGSALYQGIKVEQFNAPPQEPAARVDGGIGAFVEAIAKQLHNTKINLHDTVISLTLNPLGVQIQTQKTQYVADFVINTLPPRLASKLIYKPPLPIKSLKHLQSTPTWMGHVAKVVVTYKETFWRAEGLSGFAFCNYPPLSEVHDATTAREAALFGFINAKYVGTTIQEDVIKQLAILFGPKAKEYKKFYIVNWNQEHYTAVEDDITPLSNHPHYGYNISALENKLFFSGTESSLHEGGYIEGALMSAHTVVKKIL
jgi:monoamine oxidase